MPNILEMHVLQSFSTNCLNRDDTNSVKTVDIGGAKRTRISSQCLKRAARVQMHEDGIKTGIRSRGFAERITAMISAERGDETPAETLECASEVVKALGGGDKLNTLLFLSEAELHDAADLIIAAGFDPKKCAREAQKMSARLTKERGSHDALDIAAFGRMVASRRDFDVEAAVSVAHAYTTHRTMTGVDWFTAVDDLNKEVATGHIGTNEYSSGTFYRYITIDLDLLQKNLGLEKLEDVSEAAGALVHAFFFAVPKARQHTMAAFRAWDYAHIMIRRGQPQQCIFEKPVTAKGNSGLLEPSIDALEDDISRTSRLFGKAYGLKYETVFGQDSRSIYDLIGDLKAHITGV